MKTLVVGNQKGGVGKSAISTHMAYYLAEKGFSVAFVDLDTQANSSSSFGDAASSRLAAFDLFSATSINTDVAKGVVQVWKGSDDLAKVDRVGKAAAVVGALRPRMAELDALGFDFCIIDTPPALSNRLFAALAVADFVLCPIELSRYSSDGIKKMVQTINTVRNRFNKKLVFLGMLANRVNSRSKIQTDALRDLLRTYPDHMLKAHLVSRAAFSQALDEAIPVWQLRTGSARVAASEMKKVMAFLHSRLLVEST